MGIRLDFRRVDGQDGVEQMGQLDAVGFGDKAKQFTVSVEAPGAALLDNLDLRFGVPLEKLIAELSHRGPIGKGQDIGAVPLYTDHGDERVRSYAA